MSLEGVQRSETLATITLHSDSLLALDQLQYLSLTKVELLDASSEEMALVPVAANNENPSNSIYFLDQEDTVLPYEEFKKLQQARTEPWKGFVQLKNLEYLFISHCRLPEAFSRGHSGAFTSLGHLKELVIRSSQMRVRLETEAGDLKELESLSLSDNQLLDLEPGDLQSMDSLHTLDLSGNQLTRLTENSFPLMPDLEWLDLSGNPLKIVYSKAFVNVSSLRKLLLGSYGWKEQESLEDDETSFEFQPDSFYGLAKLRELWIGLAHPSGSGIGPDYFRDLISLAELHIRGKLVTIEADTFSSSRRLQIVDLKGCHLRRLSVDAFQSLSKLRILDLSANELDQLTGGVFDPLVSLKELWLNGNRLTSISSGIFATLTTTKLIRLEGNPWHCTCQLNQLRATSVNKITVFDSINNRTGYQYDRRVAPLCASPEGLKGAAIFDVMRKPLRCNKAEQQFPTKDLPEFRRIDVWNEPLETIDHGPEATDEHQTYSQDSIIPRPGVNAMDHAHDIIDHGEEVIEDTTPHTKTFSKPINQVLPQSYNTLHPKGSIPNLKSFYYFPTISKKSLKLSTEQEKKKDSKKKFFNEF